ncbi:MAG: EAL domain-containing protein [Lachnospiraceae bacterium]|nr:EAL domain-containing protein [Lachnospiraceae bacterium]
MNIQIQVCGMIILVLLFVFYRSQKSLQLYTEKAFYMTFCMAIINLALDILSILFIEYRALFPDVAVRGVCKLYIISLVWEAAFALHYVLVDLLSERSHRKWKGFLVCLTCLESAVVTAFPIYIYHGEGVTYTYGPSTLFVYAFTLIYILATIVVLAIFGKRLNKRRRFAVGVWMTVWVSAALLQYFNSALLVVGFASVIGVLILFVVVENPQANIERKFGCFNAYALSEYAKQLFARKEKFSLLEITIEDLEGIEKYVADFDAIIEQMLLLTDKHSDVKVFRNVNSEFLILGNDVQKLEQVGDEIRQIFARSAYLYNNIQMIVVQNADVFSGLNELMHFLSFVEDSYMEDGAARLFVTDENVVGKYREHNVIQHKIATALEEDRVEVFFQPIYSNKESRFTSAEALVRIREKDGGLMPPGMFISVAEQSGQIVQLGERVFEKVCEFLKTSDVIAHGIEYVEINLSVVQCEMEDLADRLISLIEKYQVSPKHINLEITETASVTARSILLKNMNRLVDYGFSFSLDDFGKGESNLMYVVEMPVDLIKLDYDMSKAFFASAKAQHVVRAVVHMAHGIDLKLVAEGIETKDEIDGMFREKIDYIQGYYYSKPLPQHEFISFVKRQNYN